MSLQLFSYKNGGKGEEKVEGGEREIKITTKQVITAPMPENVCM